MPGWQGQAMKTVKKDLNKENIYRQFTQGCSFMASSLDKLACNLNNDQCKKLKEFYI